MGLFLPGVAAVLLATCALGAASAATTVRISPIADTTIYAEQSGSPAYDATSDGAGPNLWTSVLAAGVTRRALVRFDLSAVPKGSRIIGAQLQLFEIRARDEHVVSTHRLLASWGEAGSNGGDAGIGAPAQPGDATWSHRFWPTQTWKTRGGEFVDTPSASLSVGFGPGAFVWPSTTRAVADVQQARHRHARQRAAAAAVGRRRRRARELPLQLALQAQPRLPRKRVQEQRARVRRRARVVGGRARVHARRHEVRHARRLPADDGHG